MKKRWFALATAGALTVAACLLAACGGDEQFSAPENVTVSGGVL